MQSELCDMIVTGECLISQDESRPVLTGGVAVAVKEGKVAAFGKRSEVLTEWRSGDVRDLGESLLMPGLVNAHTHVPMTFLRGFADDLPLMEWLTRHIFPVEAHLTREIVALGARMGMYEMMRTGTTSFVDSYLLEESVLETALSMGMRCVGGEVVFAFPSPAYSGMEGAAELYRNHAERFPAGSRVQTALMPHSVYTTNDDVLASCRDLAEELDLMLHIHLSESSGEVAQSCEQHGGRRPVSYAADMGLLSARSVLAHMVDLTDSELELVARSGAQVVHNPASNLKLASGFARVDEMRRAGVSVALGTDGACSNNTLDMFETMKLAALLSKGSTLDATSMPAADALRMATVDGARIFRTPGLGTLSVGAPADMIALDLTEPNMIPVFNPVSHAVYSASGKDCMMTMVDGKILYEKGCYLDGCYEDTRLALGDLVGWVRDRAAGK